MRFYALGMALMFIVSNPVIAAPVALPSLAAPSTTDRVGIVAAIKGSVKINSKGQIGRVIESGDAVYLGDEIATDANSSLQILLLDQTTFTIGPNSAIIIDKFVYDPSTDDGEVRAKVVKGVFRFVTGKVGQKKPSQMAVDLPVGTIGIRGTIVAGEAGADKSMVALLGPGKNNNTQHKDGSFSLQNSVNGETKQTVVSKSGFGATIDSTGVPSGAFQVPEADLNRLANSLGSGGGDDSGSSQSPSGGSGSSSGSDDDSEGDGESPTQQAGQDTAVAGESSTILTDIQTTSGAADRETATVAQEESEEFFEDFSSLFNSISTYDQLRSIPTGQFHFSKTGVPMYGNSTQVGHYDITYDIDFGARTVGGGNSKLTIDVTDGGLVINNKDFAITGNAFTSGQGLAIFQKSFAISSTMAAGCVVDCTASLYVTLNNNNGDIASSMTSVVVVEDTNQNPDKSYAGADVTSNKNPGLS